MHWQCDRSGRSRCHIHVDHALAHRHEFAGLVAAQSWQPEIVFAMRDIFRHVDEHWPRTTAGRHCEGAAAAGRHFLPDRGFASIGYGVPGGIGAQLLRFC